MQARTSENIKKTILDIAHFLKTSWKSVAIIGPCLIILYYFIGSLTVEKIDKDINFESLKEYKGYAFIQTSADLIKREIDDHMFTPNLPFFFPASVLDNMPSYQKGIIESLANTIDFVSKSVSDTEIVKASSLLHYPANVWLFSKTKDFKIEPSSVAQYRKARRSLLKFNETAVVEKKVIYQVLSAVEKNMGLVEQKLQKNIDLRRTLKADNVFFWAQGNLYADFLLLKSAQKDLMFDSSSVLRPLKQGLDMKPLFVRNGKINSTTTPNHLLTLAYFTLKARTELNRQIEELKNAD